jgi:hypothetical protein
MRNCAFHSDYLADRMGHASISPDTACEAGSFAALTLTYTAGYFGIDDTGSLKIVHRFASDSGKMQFTDPAGWNYVTAEASNGAVLELRYDQKGNIRPWDKTLSIRVQRGFLREGDRIVVRIGDTRQGSPGIRIQTFSEPTFEFKVLVDAFATYNFVELPLQPSFAVVAGPPVLYKAVLPTQRRVELVARRVLGVLAEDVAGDQPGLADAIEELIAALRPLTPRLYSIASSLKAVDDEAHLTVAPVDYEAFGRNHVGTASLLTRSLGASGTANSLCVMTGAAIATCLGRWRAECSRCSCMPIAL